MQFGGPRTVKKVAFENKGLIKGIDKLAEAVGSTLGASGRTVVIEDDFGNAHVTKDGVTVAESILLNDPVENLGVTMMKQAAKQTATKAGDGTTTSTILAHAIINEYNKSAGDTSFRDIRNGLEKHLDYTIGQLDRRAVKVDEKRLEDVSVISANGDKVLGKLIADAFKSAGDTGVVTHQSSGSSETYVENVDGTHINNTCSSHHFYTNSEKEISELENPLVFLSASSIPNVRRIQDILEYAIKKNRSILLIAPLEAQPMAALAMNKVKGNIKVNVVDAPLFGLKRKDILDDIALLTGATVINEELGDALDMIGPDVLGSAEKAISDIDGTTLTFSETPEGLQERIDYLKSVLNADEDHHVMTKHLEQRLSLLSGGVSIINVGAETEVELKEKQDRVDDAVQAVKAAKKEGILPGGGSALHYVAANGSSAIHSEGEQVGWDILKEALYAPFNKILVNGSLDPKESQYSIKNGD